MPRYLTRLSLAELKKKLRALMVSTDVLPKAGKWAIHPYVPAIGTPIYVVDSTLLCAGTAVATYHVKDIDVEFKEEGFEMPKKSAVVKLTAKADRRIGDYDQEIEIELEPGVAPGMLVAGNTDPFDQADCFLDRAEAIAYAQEMLNKAQNALRGALKKAA